MANDIMYIGCTPCDEDCAQVGHTKDYARMARIECTAFINQIRRELGIEPAGAQLSIKGQAHDFGTYYEVVCYYNPENRAATDYAFKCESTDANWDEAAQRELTAMGYKL